MLYNSFVIVGLKCLLQLNCTAHFGDLIQKNWRFEICNLGFDFTQKFVIRMVSVPQWLKECLPKKLLHERELSQAVFINSYDSCSMVARFDYHIKDSS